MPRPTIHAAAVGMLMFAVCHGAAIAATILVEGETPPLDAAFFILGLIGSASICAWLQRIDTTQRTYGTLTLCTLLAGFGTPISSVYLGNKLGIPPKDLFYVLPFLIGVILPIAVPFGLDFIQYRYKVGEGKRSNDA